MVMVVLDPSLIEEDCPSRYMVWVRRIITHLQLLYIHCNEKVARDPRMLF